MFPAWADSDIIDHYLDLPNLNSAFAGFAWHGNGIAMGNYAGAILADLLQKKPAGTPIPPD